jgi:Mg/Co/Ni transporter MgtE
MSLLILYTVFAFLLDFVSTIILGNYRLEENDIIRYIWQHFGIIGFFLTCLLSCFAFIAIIVNGWVRGYKKTITITVVLLMTFKIIIALTNLGIAPYWLTAWYSL